MDRCQHCREQLLDYLYDLLDGSEQVALEAHLGQCAACRQELVSARDQQHLLACAARLECRPASFTPPAEHRVTADLDPIAQPAVLPLRQRRPGLELRPWMAVAAALLLLLCAGLYARHDVAQLTQQVAEHQLAWNQTRNELVAVQTRQGDVAQYQRRERARLAEREEREQLDLQVTVPQVLAGMETAPPQVEVRDARGRSVEASLSLKLVDARGEARSLARKAGESPAWPERSELAPGEYSLLVLAERGDDARTQISVPIRVPAPQIVTYASTDRPVYQAGLDVVHYRSLSLVRQTLQPVSERLLLEYVLRLPDGREMPLTQGQDRLRSSGPSPKLLNGPDGKPLTGLGTGSFPLPADLPGGEYAIVVREGQGRFAETAARFLVNRPARIRFDGEPTWGRPAYRPGDAFEVNVRLQRTNGERLRGKLITARLLVDGHEHGGAQNLVTDNEGHVPIQSRIPLYAQRATLVIALQQGTTTDEVRTLVPLYLPTARLEFYPEGGDLVAGVENRVYFQARDRCDVPVVLTGELLQDDKPMGITITTQTVPEVGETSGLGSFRFTPHAGSRYSVRVTRPAETPVHRLPPVVTDGVQLTIAQAVLDAGQPLEVLVQTTSPRPLRAVLTSREQVLEILPVSPGQRSTVRFSGKATRAALGVCRVTIVEEVALVGHAMPGLSLATGMVGPGTNPLAMTNVLLAGARESIHELLPRAERLVYCRPTQRLELTARATLEQGKEAAAQGKLFLQAQDEKAKGVPAVAQVGVVDRAALGDARRRTARSLPTQAWLAAELPSSDLLEWGDLLLLPQDASRTALDLLLATQGWRRFEARPGSIGGEPILTARAQHRPDYPALVREREQLQQTTTDQLAALAQRETQVRERLTALQQEPALAEAQARLAWYQEQQPRMHRAALVLLGGLVLALALLVVYRLIQGELERVRPYLVLVGGSAALLVFLLLPANGVSPEIDLASLPDSLSRVPVNGDEQRKSVGTADLQTADPQGVELAQVWVLDRLPTRGAEREQREAAARGALPQAAANGFSAATKPWTEAGKPGKVNELNDARSERTDLYQRMGEQKAEAQAITRASPLSPPVLAPAAPVEADKLGGGGVGNATEEFRRHLLEDMERKRVEGQQMQLAPAAKQARDEKEALARAQPLVVRVFANESAKRQATDRDGWTPLVYWHPVLILPGEGTTVEFTLGNSLKGYQLEIQAHTLDGRLGHLRQNLVKPAEK